MLTSSKTQDLYSGDVWVQSQLVLQLSLPRIFYTLILFKQMVEYLSWICY